MDQKPTIGRIVHYYTPGDTLSHSFAAIVTSVSDDGTLGLYVIDPEKPFFRNVSTMGGPDGTTPTPGCWNWPPRE